MTRVRDLAATTLLSPALALQALWVVSRATRLPEAEGARAGTVGTGPPLRVLIVGDSSAAGVGVAHQDDALAGQLARVLSVDRQVSWTLLAQSGATTSHGLRWLADHDGGPYDAALLAFGVNDTKNAMPLFRWRSNIAGLIESLRPRAGCICFSALPPMGQFPLLPQPLRWTLGRRAALFDQHLADIAGRSPEVRVIRPDLSLDPALMATDGFHPGPAVYRVWAETAAAAIRAHPAVSGP